MHWYGGNDADPERDYRDDYGRGADGCFCRTDDKSDFRVGENNEIQIQ